MRQQYAAAATYREISAGAGLLLDGLVGGAVGEAVGGNNIELSQNTQAAKRYQAYIQLNNGKRIRVMEESIADLCIDDRVHLVDGHVHRN